MLYHLNAQLQWFSVSPTAYGIFTGSTVHEVDHVVAAAHAISDDAANTAVIAKMVRVMMLAAFLIILSAWLSRSSAAADHLGDRDQKPAKVVIPWFALMFVDVAGTNSLSILPHALLATIIDIDTVMLAMAMAALGLTTHLSAIRKAGVEPLLLGLVLFMWLIAGA